MKKNSGYRKPYQNKAFFNKENYLNKEEAKKLRTWLIVGYTTGLIDSSQPFSKRRDIHNLIYKHPDSFKTILNDNIKCVDNKIIVYSLACIFTSGRPGKPVLNDLFLKYVKTLSDLYYFVSYIKEMRSISESITPYITKYIRSQSFDKIHREIITYRNHETEITFSFLISKCGLKAKDEREQLYFDSITNLKGKCYIPFLEDFYNIKKGKPCKNINLFSYEMLPEKNSMFADSVVKNTNINTILNNMKFFKEVDSIKYVSKTTTQYVNKYIAAKAYTHCDNALKHIIKEQIDTKKLKKKICNVIDFDLAGIEILGLPAKNIPFIFGAQFETSYNIIVENHDRFRDIELDIEDILNDDLITDVKLRENTTVYFDNIIGHLLEEEKKVDTILIFSYGKEFTMKKRPQMLDVYETYTGKEVKFIYIYFNNQKDFNTGDNILNIKGFDFFRTEEIIKRFIFLDI